MMISLWVVFEALTNQEVKSDIERGCEEFQSLFTFLIKNLYGIFYAVDRSKLYGVLRKYSIIHRMKMCFSLSALFRNFMQLERLNSCFSSGL